IEVKDELKDFSVKDLLDAIDVPGALQMSSIDADRLGISLPRELFDGLSLFISYSHKDERYRDELRGALTVYERKGELVTWDDTKIVPGQRWEPEIMAKLERADIVMLLLSNDFIRS